MLEICQAPRGQSCQAKHHAHHAQRGHYSGSHAGLVSPHGVDSCCTDWRNHQAKAKTGGDRTNRNLRPANIHRPATHQVETCRREEQAEHSCKAGRDAAAQPATQESADRNQGRKAEQRESTGERQISLAYILA